MYMYLTAEGRYARTKDEAGKGATKIDVPTDARGLVEYLNRLPGPALPIRCDCASRDAQETYLAQEFDGPFPTKLVEVTAPPALPANDPNGSIPILAPMTLVAVEEFIQAAGPVELASCASNVAWRYKELGKELSR